MSAMLKKKKHIFARKYRCLSLKMKRQGGVKNVPSAFISYHMYIICRSNVRCRNEMSPVSPSDVLPKRSFCLSWPASGIQWQPLICKGAFSSSKISYRLQISLMKHSTKGRLCIPKRINFRKSFKQPSTPLPIHSLPLCSAQNDKEF